MNTTCNFGFYYTQKSQPCNAELGFCCLFGISFVSYLCFSFRYDRNETFVSSSFAEINHSVYKSIERVVFTDTNVLSRVVLCATLANDDVSGNHFLPSVHLDT